MTAMRPGFIFALPICLLSSAPLLLAASASAALPPQIRCDITANYSHAVEDRNHSYPVQPVSKEFPLPLNSVASISLGSFDEPGQISTRAEFSRSGSKINVVVYSIGSNGQEKATNAFELKTETSGIETKFYNPSAVETALKRHPIQNDQLYISLMNSSALHEIPSNLFVYGTVSCFF